MARYAVAGIVVAALALGVWWLLPRADETPSTTTVLAPTTTASTTTAEPSGPTTTTTEPAAESHVVETVEEAEEVLRHLWFGWFEGIHNQDEDRIREVVATEELVEEAKSQFGRMSFERAPVLADLEFRSTEIIRSDPSCLAVWTTLVLSGFRTGESEGVHVLRWRNDRWVSLSIWASPRDLWEQDCVSQLG